MADVTIDAAAIALTQRGMRGMVFVTNLIGYFFFIDGDSDFYYTKTSDGGVTWQTPVAISGADTIVAFDVWYDQWTPGNTDRCIHIWNFGITATDDVNYNRLNTTNDSLSSTVTVFAGASAVAGRGTFVSGAKMRGGNLICCFDIDAGAEMGTYRSIDNGETWTARTNIMEATLDQAVVFPGNEADPQDAYFIYQDNDMDEFTIKMHDDSADTNSESALIATVDSGPTDLTGQYPFSGAIRFSDGHLIIAVCTDRDDVTADFRVFDINGTASITELTALVSNVDDFYYPSVFIEQRTGDIYVAYIGKLDSSEALDTGAGVYYAKSTDRGVTWTKDLAYSATASDWRGTWAPISGPRFMVAWQDISSVAMMTNTDNSKEFLGPITNNFKFARCVSAGVMSVSEKIR